ncbi:MAG: 23S rRNA (guanosine(2251)-2'-O)-methyltransferase RlmB [Nitrospiraceae bacterium]|nr:23S rRNA (guanosine(2251)-2'-O)-methyltransferase RlmB [Nitrospiraceae bacterium]
MNPKAVFGRNAVEEALRAHAEVNRLYLAKESRAPWADAILDEARERRIRFDFVPQAKLNEICGSHEHQGVVAIVSPVAYTTLEECLQRCGPQATLLALDRVQNPRNLGMMIRTALGAGVAAVLVPARGGALLDDDVTRASAGALFHVPIVKCGNLPQALRKCRDAGFWVYGLAGEGEMDVFAVDWPDRVVLVMGNETEGLRHGVAKTCDSLVRIPLAKGLRSLNVAVAAGISLFQIAAQLRGHHT